MSFWFEPEQDPNKGYKMRVILFGIGILVILGMVIVALYDSHRTYVSRNEDTADWYLVCTSKTKDYVVASKGKPYVNGAFYVINGENYITPEPLTTCGMIRKENFDEAVQKKDQPDA